MSFTLLFLSMSKTLFHDAFTLLLDESLHFLNRQLQCHQLGESLPVILGNTNGSGAATVPRYTSSCISEALNTSLLNLIILFQGFEHIESRGPVSFS